MHKSTRPTFSGGRESILNLISPSIPHKMQVDYWKQLYRSTVDTERSIVSSTQSKFEEGTISSQKVLKHAFYFVYLFKTAIFVTCLG